jgi:hypothetical protein
MKRGLQEAAARGADLFFSAADAQHAQDTQETQHAQQTVMPHKAQDEQPAQLAQTVQEMQEAIITQEAERAARKEARKAETAARKASRKRLNIEISAESYDYIRIMAGITGTSVNAFLAALIDREAATNNETYKAARELINNARK